MAKRKKWLILAGIAGLVIATAATAAETVSEKSITSATAAETVSEKSITSPVKGTVGYTFLSDYIWRGLNMTDILGGHEGKGAHELTYGLSLDLADVGIENVGEIGVTFKHAWFNAYQNTDASRALTDIALSLTRPVEAIAATMCIEWRNYRWENENTFDGMDERTQEFTVGLAFRDGGLWKALGCDMGESVLNPTVKWIVDYELAEGGQLWQFGISHPFDMAEFTPELAGISLTPSLTAALDSRYYGSYISKLRGVHAEDTTKWAYMDWGIGAGADLTKMLGISCGKLGFKGGVGYIQAFEKLADSVLHDTLYSYIGVTYNW